MSDLQFIILWAVKPIGSKNKSFNFCVPVKTSSGFYLYLTFLPWLPCQATLIVGLIILGGKRGIDFLLNFDQVCRLDVITAAGELDTPKRRVPSTRRSTGPSARPRRTRTNSTTRRPARLVRRSLIRKVT